MVKNRFIFILFFFFFILTWFSSPSPVAAQVACKTDGDGNCFTTAYPVTCSFTSASGLVTEACCRTNAACTEFKSDLANGSVRTRNKQVWNPECQGEKGIDTALGCLPYEFKGNQLTSNLLTLAIGIVGAISLIVMLIATVTIMTSGGNPEQTKKGKELFTGAVAGLLFIIFSVTLLRLIAGDIIQLPGFK